MNDASWAVAEFANAHLGDSRRDARLIELATTLAAQPSAALPQACADQAQLDAAYRFFDNEHITHAAILEGHFQATTLRCATQPLILAAQDTTLLDYSHHPATSGLGPLASPKQQGLLAHSTLAITPQRLPLGLLEQQTWTRDPHDVGKRERRRDLAISDKESYKWLRSLEQVNKAAQACPNTRFISVGDREADVYDLFLLARQQNVDLLVRAAWDRCTQGEEQRLWACMQAASASTTASVCLPRRGEQAPRTATVTVRWRAVSLQPPQSRYKEKLRAVGVWVVWAIEEQPPPGVQPLEWMLITSCAVLDGAAALERLDWYSCRWGIELWHKVLKSGCRIEARQLASAARLQRALGLYSVIAWRVLYSTLLARVEGDLPCSVLLEQAEWEALYCTIHAVATLPQQAPSLRQAVRWIAQLGGFLGRKGDGEPGVTVLWRGFQRLYDLTTMYRIMLRSSRTYVLRKD